MKAKDFIKLEDEIKQILIDDPRARDDDMYLYWKYAKQVFNECDSNSIQGISYPQFLANAFLNSYIRKDANLKTFAAVIRVRRKIQEKCPELESERAKKARAKKEEEFKDYSRL